MNATHIEEWLTIPEAAARLGMTLIAVRSRVYRRTIRSKKDNKKRLLVCVEGPPAQPAVAPAAPPGNTPASPPEPIQRRPSGAGSAANALGPMVPMRVLETITALHREELERERARHQAELERLERAYKTASDALMTKVAAILVANRPRPWWRIW